MAARSHKADGHPWIVVVASGVSLKPGMRANGGLMCRRCGETQALPPGPTLVKIVIAIGTTFEKPHKRCPAHVKGDVCVKCLERGHETGDCPKASSK